MMRSDQQPKARPKRRVSPSLESLEGRALLSLPSVSLGGGPPIYPTPSPTTTTPPPVSNPTRLPVSNPMPAPISNPFPTGKTPAPGPIATLNHPGTASSPPPSISPRSVHHTNHAIPLHATSGVVVKSPRFYSAYTGPKLAELNAVKASAKLLANGDFRFTGTNQGRITRAPAVYVWGLDRIGNLPAGPFTGRPNIKFDAVVIVQIDSSLTATAQVVQPGQRRRHRPARGVGPHPGSHGHGPGPREPAPLDGPGPVAVPLQLLARGRRTARLRLGSQLRARVHHGAGRDGAARLMSIPPETKSSSRPGIRPIRRTGFPRPGLSGLARPEVVSSYAENR